jgi:hypothetical protein
MLEEWLETLADKYGRCAESGTYIFTLDRLLIESMIGDDLLPNENAQD